MSKNDIETGAECVNRFIELANAMKDEDIDIKTISAGLMSASCVYATFVLGGNDGGLTESGVEKVAEVYKRELERVQKIKKDNSGV